MSRWISCVRPPIRPLTDSRSVRSAVARGSIEYSAVTQPVPLPRRCGGTRSAIVAAHSTCGVAEPDEARALGPLLDAEL